MHDGRPLPTSEARDLDSSFHSLGTWLSGFKGVNRFSGTCQPLVHRMPGGKQVEGQRPQSAEIQASGYGCGRVLGCHAWSLRLDLQHPPPSMAVHAFFSQGLRDRSRRIRRSRSSWTTGDPVSKQQSQASAPHLTIVEPVTYPARDLGSHPCQ